MNRIGILDGYDDYGSFSDFAGRGGRKKRRRKRKMSTKQRRHLARFKKAAKSCARRRSGSFKGCMKKKLKRKGRR